MTESSGDVLPNPTKPKTDWRPLEPVWVIDAGKRLLKKDPGLSEDQNIANRDMAAYAILRAGLLAENLLKTNEFPKHKAPLQKVLTKAVQLLDDGLLDEYIKRHNSYTEQTTIRKSLIKTLFKHGYFGIIKDTQLADKLIKDTEDFESRQEFKQKAIEFIERHRPPKK